MIPTGRLWVLLCLLAVPMMAAGFFPGLGGAVLLLDVLALGLAGWTCCSRAGCIWR